MPELPEAEIKESSEDGVSLRERISKAREGQAETSLKARIAKARAPESSNEEFAREMTSHPIARTFEQGFFFGFSDEIEAAGRAIWDRLPGEDFGDAYLRNRNKIRGEVEGFREEHPIASFGLEVAGGMATAGAGTGAAVAAGKTLTRRMIRGVPSGAATGAIFGAGKAEELQDIPGEVATGAAFGAAAGGAVPPVIEGGRLVFSGVRAAAQPVVGASRRLGQSLRRDEMTPEQLAGALEEARSLGKPVTVADVGGAAVRRELETAVQRPGPSAQLAERFFTGRNKEQLNRLSKDLVKGTGVNADAVEDVIAKTMHLRSKAAKPVYAKAMDFAAELNDDIVNSWNQALKTPLGKQAMGKARKILNVENFDEAPLMERIDAFKRGLDDIIGSAKQKGENQIARKALEVKHDLVGKVDNVNPAYRKARQIWENGSSYLDAMNRGREVLRPNFTASQLKREFAEMTNAEQEAFRIGVVDAVVTKMRQQSAKEPNLVKLIRSPEIRDKLKAVMHPEMAAKLDKILDIEDAMFATASQVTKGSQTAQRTAAMAEQERQLSALRGLDFILELAITPLRTIFTRALPAIPRATRERLLTRQNEEIARRLLSSETDEIFKIPALQAPKHLEGVAIPPAIMADD